MVSVLHFLFPAPHKPCLSSHRPNATILINDSPEEAQHHAADFNTPNSRLDRRRRPLNYRQDHLQDEREPVRHPFYAR